MKTFTYLNYNFYRSDEKDMWIYVSFHISLYNRITFLGLFFIGVHFQMVSRILWHWHAKPKMGSTHLLVSEIDHVWEKSKIGRHEPTELLKSKSRIWCDFHCFSQSLWNANSLHIFKEQNLSPKTVQNSLLQRKILQDLCYWTRTRNKRKTSENSIKMTDIRGGRACHEMRDFLLTDEHLWTLTQ